MKYSKAIAKDKSNAQTNITNDELNVSSQNYDNDWTCHVSRVNQELWAGLMVVTMFYSGNAVYLVVETHWHTLLGLQGSWRYSHIAGRAECHTETAYCRPHPAAAHTPDSTGTHREWEECLLGSLVQSFGTDKGCHTADSTPKTGYRKT